jgi:hypothetical protein
MANSPVAELRRTLKGADGVTLIDSLKNEEAKLLLHAMQAAQAREKAALDAAIDNSLRMVPLVLRGAFRKVLFP